MRDLNKSNVVAEKGPIFKLHGNPITSRAWKATELTISVGSGGGVLVRRDASTGIQAIAGSENPKPALGIQQGGQCERNGQARAHSCAALGQSRYPVVAVPSLRASPPWRIAEIRAGLRCWVTLEIEAGLAVEGGSGTHNQNLALPSVPIAMARTRAQTAAQRALPSPPSNYQGNLFFAAPKDISADACRKSTPGHPAAQRQLSKARYQACRTQSLASN